MQLHFIEYLDLERTYHWVQLLASHKTTQNSDHMSESIEQTLLELQQPILCPLPSGADPFPNSPGLPLTQLPVP